MTYFKPKKIPKLFLIYKNKNNNMNHIKNFKLFESDTVDFSQIDN